MAFTGSNIVCTSFKVDVLKGLHDFTTSTGDVFKIALYTNSATLTAADTAYTATGEASGTGYTATGLVITSVTPVASGTTAVCDFSPDALWTTSSFTARGALIYNTTPTSGTRTTIVILDFGSDKTSSAGDFTVIFPAADASNAIIRIA